MIVKVVNRNHWRKKSQRPEHGQLVEVRGSDFMGEWTAQAVFEIRKDGKPRWVGQGFMGKRLRPLDNSDVEAWRPLAGE